MSSRAASPADSSDASSHCDEAPKTSPAKLAFCSVFTPTWTSALLLFACFFLPLVRGCGENIVYPYSFYDDMHSAHDFFGRQVYTWSYGFALLTAVGTLLLAVSRNPAHYRTQWWGYALLIVVVTIGIWFAIGADAQHVDEKPAARDIIAAYWWVLLPTAVLTAAVVITYFNCRTWFAAALWLRLFLTSLATIWFALFLEGLLWGGRLSLAACTVLFFSTISERALAMRALGVDPNKLRRRTSGRERPAARPLPTRLAVVLSSLPVIAAILLSPYVLSEDPPAQTTAGSPVFTTATSIAGKLTLGGAPVVSDSDAEVEIMFHAVDESGQLQDAIYAGKYDPAASRYRADLPPGAYRVTVQAWKPETPGSDLLGGRFADDRSTVDLTVAGPDEALNIELAPPGQ